MSKKCEECLKGVNKNHLEDLDFQRKDILEKVEKLIDEYKWFTVWEEPDKAFDEHNNNLEELKLELKRLKDENQE